MTGRKRDKRKAPAERSRTTEDESWDPNFRPLDTDDSLLRMTPYPIVPSSHSAAHVAGSIPDPPIAPHIPTVEGSDTQDFSTQPPKGFGVDIAGASGSNVHEVEKVHIEPRGNDELTVPEKFIHTHSCMNAQGERVWVDERSKSQYTKYIETFETSSSDAGSNSTPTLTATQLERWTELARSSKKGKVYDLGGSTDSHSSHTAGYKSSARERELENQVRRLKESFDSQSAEIAELRAQVAGVEELRAQVAGVDELRAQVAGVDELRAQVALLTSAMMAQQRMNVSFPSTRQARTLLTPPIIPSAQPAEGTQHFPTPFYPPRSIYNADNQDDEDDSND